jgi:diaminopimelate epimerase
MRMKFTKMHGAGNDFIIINLMEEKIPLSALPALAKRLCTPKLSIGADGLMAVDHATTPQADYRMLFYNSDGSEGEMCGNGARCIARYGYEKGLAGETQRIETISGIVIGQRKSKRMYTVRLNDPSVLKPDYPVEVDGKTYDCAYVELGTPGLPHAAVRLDALDTIDEDSLRILGRKLRWHPAFPKGANVNFYKCIGPDHVLERTFERGVEDFTLACGTGSGSVAAVLTVKGLVSGKDVRLSMPGGDLYITVTADGQHVHDIFLTGPTNMVCEGEITDEDLLLPE